MHWHGDHPQQLQNCYGISGWVKGFEALAQGLKAEGVEVVNCTIETAIPYFERADLRDVL